MIHEAFGAEYLEERSEEARLSGGGMMSCFYMKSGGYYCVRNGQIVMYIEA